MIINRCLIILCATLALTSCKLRIVVPEGGNVESSSGAFYCAAGKTCNIDIVDFYFDETFIAKPKTGYKFKYWKKANRRFCGGKSKPCRVFTAGLNANKDLANVMTSFFESEEIFYLQPEFEKLENSATSCTNYLGSSKYCDDGVYPNCSVPLQVTSQLRDGMTYQEVVKLFGCHGHLTRFSGDSADYEWGTESYVPGLSKPDVLITFWTAFSSTPEIVVFVAF